MATRPRIVATLAIQSPNPSGAKIGAIILPNPAKIESSGSALKSTKCPDTEILFKNQITTVARRITVPALTIKALHLNQVALKIFLALGI